MSSGLRVAMWSGPRNISTAMMRAWENREDTAVVDEPFYAHYLKATGVEHPGRAEVLASQPLDWRAVAADLTGPIPDGKGIWYQKHMTQHMLPDMSLEWLDTLANCFLIRRPEEVVASFTAQRPDAAVWELGYEQQMRIFEHVRARTRREPLVIDAGDVLRDPSAILGALCRQLGIPFSDRMLHWPAGRRQKDGIWARYWYQAVERSTGFEAYQPQEVELSPFQANLVAQCRPHYERLAANCLRA